MNVLTKKILLPSMPASQKIPQYIGQQLEEIANIHKHYHITVPDSRTPHILIIEIRFLQSTLTCCIMYNICTEAYLFEDRDITN